MIIKFEEFINETASDNREDRGQVFPYSFPNNDVTMNTSYPNSSSLRRKKYKDKKHLYKKRTL